MRIETGEIPIGTKKIKSRNIFIEEKYDTQKNVLCPRIAFFDRRFKKIIDLKLLMWLYYEAVRHDGHFTIRGASYALEYSYSRTLKSLNRLVDYGYVKILRRKKGTFSFIILKYIEDPRKYHIRDLIGVSRKMDTNWKKMHKKRVYKRRKKNEPKTKFRTRICAQKGYYIEGPLAGQAVREELRHLPVPDFITKLAEQWRIDSTGQKTNTIKNTPELKEESKEKTCISGSLQKDTTNLSPEEYAKDATQKQNV